MASHSVSTTFNGGMSFTAEVGDHHIRMDAGPADGGIDSGPGPKKLMLTSLAGCTGIDIVSILDKMRAAFSDFSIIVDAGLSEDYPKIYNVVNILYSITIAVEDRPKMEKAVKLSEDKYCGVMAMFRSFAEVNTSIKYN